ncbi:MAG TPA: DUF5615 family PIN-like protein [Chthonomonadaceae bacterium]|nr:DUF5615 family PIN-like protein [Chthonomonadaceae bacterium]
MARLYANENFPLPAVEELRRLGHDVLTTHDAGKYGQAIPDADVLAFARSEERAVLTHNRKRFIRLHTEAPDHAGIIVCPFDADFARQGKAVDAALAAHGELSGILLLENRPANA